MASRDEKPASSGFLSAIRNWGTAVHKSVNGLLGHEGLEVINPEGGTEDAEAEAQRGRWKQEIMEYCRLLDLADECEDPYVRLVYASSWAISVYFAYQRTWKPFNPILGETYEMVNHGGITLIAEQDKGDSKESWCCPGFGASSYEG